MFFENPMHHGKGSMHRMIFGAALLLAVAATSAAAQEAPGSRLTLEPYAGAFLDSYDISPDGENVGPRAGLRFGYPLGGRARLVADASYATSNNVSDPQGLASYHLYRNVWALTTVGAEYDVVAGRTSVALGVRAGAGWRRIQLTGEVGSPGMDPYGGGGFSAVDVAVPSLTIRRELTARASLALSLEHHAFDLLEGPAEHSPGVSVGLRLR